MNAQDELAQLREKIAQLEKALGNKQQLPAPAPPSLLEDHEFVLAMARYSEGLEGYSEQEVRRRWNFSQAEWTALGSDDRLVERIQETKAARVRSGAAKREKAQLLVLKGPEILDGIATNPKTNDRHRIDAVKALDGLADPGAQATHDDTDRIRVTINLGADHKIAFDRPLRSGPVDDEVIDSTPGPIPGFMLPPNKDDDRGNPL